MRLHDLAQKAQSVGLGDEDLTGLVAELMHLGDGGVLVYSAPNMQTIVALHELARREWLRSKGV